MRSAKMDARATENEVFMYLVEKIYRRCGEVSELTHNSQRIQTRYSGRLVLAWGFTRAGWGACSCEPAKLADGLVALLYRILEGR